MLGKVKLERKRPKFNPLTRTILDSYSSVKKLRFSEKMNSANPTLPPICTFQN